MVRIEVLIVYIDGLHKLVMVKMDIVSCLKELLAIRTILISCKPAVNALNMENVIAIQHAAH